MLKYLLSCVREYRRPAILAPIYVTMEVVLDILIPFYMGRLLDYGIGLADMGYVVRTGLLLVVMCVLSLGFGALSGHSAAVAAMGFGKNLRHDMFHHVQTYSFSNIDKFSSSSIVTRLTTDVTNIQNAFMMTIRVAVRAPGMLILSMFMAFQINTSLALVFLIALPVLGVGIVVIMKSVHPIFRRVFKTYDRLNQVVQENLRGIRVVKSFVREDHEIEKFDKVSNTIFKDFTKAETIIAFNAPLMNFCAFGCMTLVAWIGARLIITTHETAMSTGQLTTMISYVMQMLMSLMFLSMIAMQIILSRASGERIVEILEEKSSLESPANAVHEVADGSIVFDHVTFSYHRNAEKPVLQDIDLTIPKGKNIAIVGASGAGKSTLVDLIPRFYDPDSGSISIDGVDLRDALTRDIRALMGNVNQEPILFNDTIFNNIAFGVENATREQVEAAAKIANAHEFIIEKEHGYQTCIGDRGTLLSGGQRQRISIARAILKNPPILILDEATASLDTESERLVQDAIDKLMDNRTTISIAHRLSTVRKADEIIVMHEGQIVERGRHEELIAKKGYYKKLYEMQAL